MFSSNHHPNSSSDKTIQTYKSYKRYLQYLDLMSILSTGEFLESIPIEPSPIPKSTVPTEITIESFTMQSQEDDNSMAQLGSPTQDPVSSVENSSEINVNNINLNTSKVDVVSGQKPNKMKESSKSRTNTTTSQQKVSELPRKVQEILAQAKLLKNFYEEKFTGTEDVFLPDGWILHIHKRPKDDHGKIQFDRYWYTPKTGKKMRSKLEVQRFLGCLDAANGDEDNAWSLFKGRKVKSLQNKKSSLVNNTSGGAKPKAEGGPPTISSNAVKSKKKDLSSKRSNGDEQRKKRDRPPKDSLNGSQAKKGKTAIMNGVTNMETIHREKKKASKAVQSSNSGVNVGNPSLIAESKTTGRKKKAASKKVVSPDPNQTSVSLHPSLPPCAESK